MKDLPESWSRIEINEVLEAKNNGKPFQQGWSPRCENFPAPEGKWGVLKTTSIQDGEFWDHEHKFLPDHLKPRPHLEVKPGDVLITCAGPRVRCGVACLVERTRPKLMMSGKMYRFRPHPKAMHPKYLTYMLQTAETQFEIDRMKTGINDSGLNLTHSRFAALKVAVAPLNEQRRIVAKIEKLFPELDKGVESLKTVRAQLKVYRQAVLKHALEGRLTAQWREEHLDPKPASELLQRILVERRRSWEENQLRKLAEKGKASPKNWKAKYKEPATTDTTDLPLLPDSWCWSSIDQLIREPLRNGHSAVASQTDGGILTFSISAVTDGDFSAKNIKMTSADPLKVQDLWVESDDIFIQRSNTPELVGTARRYRGENGRAIFPDLLIRIRITSSALPAFVELALQSVRCHGYFRHKSQGISGSMPKIDQDVVRLAAIPLPPLPEQEAIIEAVEDRLTVINHVEAEIDNQLLKADSLRQSILRRAFSGQLVAQDSSDEPASVLLDRIRAEREKNVKNKIPKKKNKRKTAA